MLTKINYKDLNSKAKEMYNFQKIAAVMADYGFTCMWLHNDWEGADFIAVHNDGNTTLKVQLKSRLTFDGKYIGKDIHICFRTDDDIYLYPHDKVLDNIKHAKDYIEKNNKVWHNSPMTKVQLSLLEEYKI